MGQTLTRPENRDRAINCMAIAPFRVSKRNLTFHQGETSSQKINVDFALFHNFGIEMVHNMPSSFTVEPNTGYITTPCEVKIYYNPLLGPEPSQEMWIKFTDKLTEKNIYNPVVVKVNLLAKNGQTAIKQKEELVAVVPEQQQAVQVQVARSEVQECRICLQPFSSSVTARIPKVLIGCGHTLCHFCIKTMVRLSANKSVIICPFDRKPTTESLFNLPTNFSVIQMLRENNSMAKKMAQKAPVLVEDPDIPCYENSKHEATQYCKTCKVEFCDECFQSVHSPKIFSGHCSVPVGEKPVELPKCPDHEGNVAQFICKHESCASQPLCCHDCLSGAHKDHQIEAIAQKVSLNEEILERIVQKLSIASIEITSRIEEAGECIRRIDKLNKEYKDTVHTVHIYFAKKKEEALKNLAVMVDSKMEFVTKEKQQIENDLGLIQETKREIEKMLKRKNTLFVQEMIEKGEAMCSLDVGRGVSFSSIKFPMLSEIIGNEFGPAKVDVPAIQSCSKTTAKRPTRVAPQPPSRVSSIRF